MANKEKFKNTQKITFAVEIENKIRSALMAAVTEQYKNETFQKDDDRLSITKLGITVDILNKNSSLTPDDRERPKYIIGATREEYRVQFQVPCDISRDSLVKGFAQKGMIVEKKDIELDADVSSGTQDIENHDDKVLPTNQYIIYLKKIKEAPAIPTLAK
jgi:hypothetical protein